MSHTTLHLHASGPVPAWAAPARGATQRPVRALPQLARETAVPA